MLSGIKFLAAFATGLALLASSTAIAHEHRRGAVTMQRSAPAMPMDRSQMMGDRMMDRMGMMRGRMSRDRMMGGRGYHGSRRGHSRRVKPASHLTVDDVRHHFEHWLERRGNKRLKLGEVKQADDKTITADIVTIDDSLVRRYRVDRHGGRISRAE